MYKLCFYSILLGGSLLFTPIRADAISTSSTATVQFTPSTQAPINPPSIAAPENSATEQHELLMTLPSLSEIPTGRLPQTDIAPVLDYQLFGLLTILIIILIKKEATYYEKNNH